MKKLILLACLSMAVAITVGCGTQNEDLAKGKEWVKSDKRGRIAKAVDFFEKAIDKEPDNAEAHHLLGYYDEYATVERRAEQMVKSYENDKKKYLEILIKETLRDRDENVRKSAAKALQDIHEIDSVLKQRHPLIKALKSKDSRDRDNAALVLSQLRNRREVVDFLIDEDAGILDHKRMGTRFDAVRALGNIGDARAIEALMERITALKTEGEKGEEPEVRRAAVVALRQIARRDIHITGKSLDIQVEPADEGVRIVGEVSKQLADRTALQKGEIISHIIDNRMITSLEDYENFLAEALTNDDTITFGTPKIVTVIASEIDELGIVKSDMKPLAGKGLVVGKLKVESKARKMGIEKGEVISHVNHQKISSVQDYERIVNEVISRGEKVNLTVADMNKYKTLSIKAPRDNADLGMTVEALPAEAGGVIVTGVKPRSPALQAGVRKGQIFSYIVNAGKVTSVDEYNRLLKQGLADNEVSISVINKTAISKLIDVLRNKGLIVRFDAAQALGEVQNAAAVESLIEMLTEQGLPIEIKL